jgi:two-component system sensor histidine kinase KdpD
VSNDAPSPTGTPRALLVAVSPSPTSSGLVLAAHRLATQIGVPWAAVHVASGTPLDDASLQRLEAHLALAQSLGADIVRLASVRVGEALAREARARGPRCLTVVGRPLDRGWGRSAFASIVRATRGLDVLLVDRPGSSIDTRALPQRRGRAWDLVLAALAVGSVTAVGIMARAWLSDADVVMSYLLVVVLLAWQRGRTASMLAALGAVASYNVGFVAPVGSFTVADPRNLVTFAVLLAVAWTVSALTARLREQERAALGRERRASVLLAWTRAFSSAASAAEVLAVLVREASAHLARTAVVTPGGPGRDEPFAATPSPAGEGTARWALGHAGMLVLTEPRPESSDLARGARAPRARFSRAHPTGRGRGGRTGTRAHGGASQRAPRLPLP